MLFLVKKRNMFEKFTEGAIRIIMAAQEEARRMGHNHVGTEQLLLGMIGQRKGIAGMVLYIQGVKLKAFRREVEKKIGRGRGFVGNEVPFTPRAKYVLEIAVVEAKDLNVNYVGSEHLLLAILTEGSGMGLRILDKFHINYNETRRLIFEFMGNIDEYDPWVPYKKDRSVISERVRAMRDRIVGPPKPEPEEEFDIYYGEYGNALGKATKAAYEQSRKEEMDKVRFEERGPDGMPERYKEFMLPEVFEAGNKRIKKKNKKYSNYTSGESARETFPRSRGNNLKNLEDYSVNITYEAYERLLDPVIGRDDVIQDLIKVLARRRKNNPVLVGEPGVGKTACAEGLALVMLDHNCPDFLRNYEIYNLDLGSVLAGTKYRGEFEERFKNILEDVQEQGNIILVIDEIHTIVGAGAAEGAVDAANLLKPALARGILKMIGATTLDEYRKHIEKDPALERRFHPIIVTEPSVETTVDILRGLKPYYQSHHALIYEDEALKAAAALSSRFITERYLPDKAIDVIDECGSLVRLRNRDLPPGLQKLLVELHATLKDIERAIETHDFNLAKLLIDHELEVRAHMKVLTLTMENDKKYSDKISTFDRVFENDITDVISAWTGIPVTKINQSETERLKKMENILHDRLIGQHHAVTAVSKAVRRARTGIQDPKRPIASFIFAGPTGVGKTELTKALAEYIFDSEKNMIRFDMSEFMERHTAAKLVGSPPGYVGHDEGGQLTDAVRRQPYSIVLFDEVEKAHPDIFNLFLQILDDGQLTDSKGKLSDFKNCIIVMTTNLGAHVIEQESPILAEKRKKSFGFDSENWEEDLISKESQKIELMVNLDGTFTVKPPVEQELTQEDEDRFSRINVLVKDELKKFFRPEFLNRVDDIIVFQHLSRHDIWQISGVMLKNLAKRLESQGATIEIDNAVRFFLTEEGYDPVYGARPLRRAIINLLEDELAVACLDNPIEKGTHIIVKQELNPNPVKYAEYFNDVYADKISITFDDSKVVTDFEMDFEVSDEMSLL
jgi:ATP-dependent Clp protease ATP-binding subunit ClpC